MVHIVFNTADAEVLKKAIELDEKLAGDIVEIKDDYAVGPLADIYTEEGINARKQWWKEILEGGDYDGWVEKGTVNDNKVVEELKQYLRENEAEELWIWAAQNKHDVSGYYWLITQLRAFQGRVQLLYLNNLPFINEKGQLFYPEWLSAIPPKEFLKAKKLARIVTVSEFEIDPDEWNKQCNEVPGVRLLEGGKKLVREGYDFYDAELTKFITGDWQKASRIIHNFLSKSKHTTGDAYLLWRLKQLIQEEGIEVQGELKKMKDFELKKVSGLTTTTPAAT